MQIDANNRLSSVGPPINARPVPAQTQTDDSNPVELQQTQALNQALAATPDSRSQQVEDARRLIASKDYPPDTILRGIANLIAAKGVGETIE